MSDKKSILLVEDDRSIGLALQIRLKAAGYNVVMASGVEQAIDKYLANTLHLAIMDISLPDGNGIDLMVHFRELRPEAIMPTIIMTASNSQGLADRAMQNGATHFLRKPFRSQELIQSLDLALA